MRSFYVYKSFKAHYKVLLTTNCNGQTVLDVALETRNNYMIVRIGEYLEEYLKCSQITMADCESMTPTLIRRCAYENILILEGLLENLSTETEKLIMLLLISESKSKV